MLISDFVYITLNSKNIKYYEDKDYDLESLRVDRKWGRSIPRGTQLKVNVYDLPENSKNYIDVKCDYCGEDIRKEYREYLNSNAKGIIKKDCCSKDECLVKKRNESNLITYGYENVFQNKDIKEKIRQYNMNNFGVEYYSQTDEFKIKYKETVLDRYGCEHVAQNQEIKDKTKATNLDKYGVEHYSQTNEYKDKIKVTCMRKYGVTHVMKVKEIKYKSISASLKTRYKNKSGIASKQQIYLCDLLKGDLNYPIDNCLLDIAFPEEKIYIEYDGSGHDLRVKMGDMTQQEFLQKEINRYYYLKNQGWKLIRFISKKDYIPNDNIIIDVFNMSKDYLNNGHSWIKFDFENYSIECSQFNQIYYNDKIII